MGLLDTENNVLYQSPFILISVHVPLLPKHIFSKDVLMTHSNINFSYGKLRQGYPYLSLSVISISELKDLPL